KLCLPVLTERYWYFTAYFALCFTRPLLNAAINSIPKREFKISFGILIFLLTVGQTTVLYSNPFGTNIGYSYLWLCVLYCLGGYLAKYKPTIRKKFLLVLIYLTCVALCWCSQFVLGKLGIVAPERLEAYNSPLVLLMAVALLLLFSQLSVSKLLGKLIAFFAPISFGVYLIHLHPLIRNNILLDLFTGCVQFPAWSWPIIALFSAALIFLICALLDWCRLKIFSLLRIKQVLSNLESRLLSKTEDK
ncbi:MAG: acyltransferase family protein, partial [Clostridia bacterium]|nr:acyltransferase family protein [Clostridia bacterium]